MPTYDSQGNLVDEAPSGPDLGLAGNSSADAGYDPGGGAEMSLGGGRLNLAAAGIPLGLSTPAQTRSQAEQEYLRSLPTSAKIGLALQAFSAGVAGHPSPIDALLKERRAQQNQDRLDLHTKLEVAVKGSAILDNLPEGSLQRQALAQQLSKLHPELTDFFNASSDGRKTVEPTLRAFQNPLVEKELLSQCSGKGGGKKFSECIIALSKDESAMKRIYAIADNSVSSDTMMTVKAALDQATKPDGPFAKYKQADGTYRVPEDELMTLAEKSKLFKPEQLDFLRRNTDRLVPYGVVPTKAAVKAQEAGLAEEERQKAKPASEKQPQTTDVGGVRYQFDPDNKLAGPRLESDPRYAALGPAKGPKEDKAPEKDTAKIERDRILLKVSRGGTPDANEEKFLQLYAKTDPFKAAIGEAISGALGGEKAPTGTAAAPAAGGTTDADQRIIAARRKVAGLTAEPKDAAGKMAWRLAGNKLSTESVAPGTPKAAAKTDVKARFDADASMSGNTLGKETPNGFEVKDKKGKLLGYFR